MCRELYQGHLLPCPVSVGQGSHEEVAMNTRFLLVIDIDKDSSRPLRSFSSSHYILQEDDLRAQAGVTAVPFSTLLGIREDSGTCPILSRILLNLFLPCGSALRSNNKYAVMGNRFPIGYPDDFLHWGERNAQAKPIRLSLIRTCSSLIMEFRT